MQHQQAISARRLKRKVGTRQQVIIDEVGPTVEHGDVRVERGGLCADLVDAAFRAYNAGRLAEACHLFSEKMIAGGGTVGLSLTGAAASAFAGSR